MRSWPDERSCVRACGRQAAAVARLERIAQRANVDLLDSGAADFVLRTDEIAAEGSGIDVAIADGVFVITCRSLPDPVVWDAVRRVIGAAVTS